MPVTSVTNVETLASLAVAAEAALDFTFGLESCFSSELEFAQIAWSGKRASFTRRSGEGAAVLDMSVERARACVAQVAALLVAEAEASDLESTATYFGSVRWTAVAPSCSGDASWSTSSPPPELVAQMLREPSALTSHLAKLQTDVTFQLRDLFREVERALRA